MDISEIRASSPRTPPVSATPRRRRTPTASTTRCGGPPPISTDAAIRPSKAAPTGPLRGSPQNAAVRIMHWVKSWTLLIMTWPAALWRAISDRLFGLEVVHLEAELLSRPENPLSARPQRQPSAQPATPAAPPPARPGSLPSALARPVKRLSRAQRAKPPATGPARPVASRPPRTSATQAQGKNAGLTQGGDDDSLRPHETLFAPVILGRSGTNGSREQAKRADFAIPTRLPLRTLGGRVTDRLLAHAFSLPDGYLGGSRSYAALRELAEQAQRYVESARPGQAESQAQIAMLLPQLVRAMRWHNTINHHMEHTQAAVREMIAALHQGEPILVPLRIYGQTAARPDASRDELLKGVASHAILMEVAPQPAGVCTLRVFNTGAGIENHPRQRGSDGNDRWQTKWEVVGVPINALASEATMMKLLASTGRYDMALIVKTIATNFEEFYRYLASLGSPSLEQARWNKPQTVGNCTWKSITAYIRSHVDEFTYRNFKTYYRSRILNEAIEQMTPDGPMPYQEIPVRAADKRRKPPEPSERLSKRDLFALADAKVRRDFDRLQALQANPTATPMPHDGAPAPKRRRLARLWPSAHNNTSEPDNSYWVTRFVTHDRNQVNTFASEEMIRRLEER